MHRRLFIWFLTLCAAWLVLPGCDGECGRSGLAISGNAAYPAAANDGWILKTSGISGAFRHGLSLAHPSKATTGYTVVLADTKVIDTRLLSGGTANTDGRQVAGSSAHPYDLGVEYSFTLSTLTVP